MPKITKKQMKESKEASKIKPGDLENVSGGVKERPLFPKRKPPYRRPE
ncbi:MULTISPECIES: hypothetical protein [Legionella]|uniref:Uncharacterized protein n=1 Tax=Legionella donaldsonii TaxID=45060 RepID=A0A378J2B1_9GAMM|nr:MULTISPECIES: hypothetical protein [Legionella]MCC5015482.1 hypothetical protein [Legionella sp. 31fI33]STX41755.1 Uncharacterised protein [Legionella donaldsonii]